MALISAIVGACFTVGYPHVGGLPTAEDGLTTLLPNGIADGLRAIIMAQTGWSLGLLALIVQRFASVSLDKKDHFTKALGFLAISYFLLTLFCGLDIVSRLGYEWISYRTPLAFIAFAISDIALVLLFNRVTDILAGANSRHATIKVTLVDTHTPPGVIDLD